VESYDTASAGTDGVRRLGASLALEGCVQRAGGKVRVLVRLVDTEQDRQLWSAQFDRDYSEDVALELESDIADAVAQELEELLSPRASSPVQAAARVGA
jgi:TolB-like protein